METASEFGGHNRETGRRWENARWEGLGDRVVAGTCDQTITTPCLLVSASNGGNFSYLTSVRKDRNVIHNILTMWTFSIYTQFVKFLIICKS